MSPMPPARQSEGACRRPHQAGTLVLVLALLPVLAACGGSPEPDGGQATSLPEATATTAIVATLAPATATPSTLDTATTAAVDPTATAILVEPTATTAPSPVATTPGSRLPPRLQGLARAPGPGLNLPGGEPLQLPFPPDGGTSLTIQGGPEGFEGQFFDVGDRLALVGSGFDPGDALEIGIYALRGSLREEDLARPERMSLERIGTWTAQVGADGTLNRDVTLPAGVQPGVFALVACRTGSCQPTESGGRASLPPAAGAWLVLRSRNGDTPWDSRVSRVHVDVEGDTLNVRARPGVNGAIRAKLPEGTAVVIEDGPVLVDPRNPWYLVTAYDGQVQGWVNGRYLQP